MSQDNKTNGKPTSASSHQDVTSGAQRENSDASPADNNSTGTTPATLKSTHRASPLPLVAIALSAIALLATLFGPFRDYASQQRADTDTSQKLGDLDDRFNAVTTKVNAAGQQVEGFAEQLSSSNNALSDKIGELDEKINQVSVGISKSLDDKLAVTRNSIDQALRSAREESTAHIAQLSQERETQLQQLRAESETALTRTKAALDTSFTTLREQASAAVKGDLERTTKSLSAALNAQQSSLTDSTKQLSGRVEQLSHNVAANATALENGVEPVITNWLLSDIEQWLRLANDRLMLGHDVEFAKTVLTLSDARLASLDDASLDNVRDVLSEDLQRITNLAMPDYQQVAKRLRELNAMVNELPFPSPPSLPSASRESSTTDVRKPPATTSETPSTQPQEQDSFLGGLKSAVKNVSSKMNLDDIVTVKKGDAAYKTLLTPEHRYFLRQNTHLMLQSSQLGLLRNDTHSYLDNLRTAQQWVREYYATDDDRVKAFLQQVDALASMDLASPTVNLELSVNALRQVNQERASQ